MKRGAFLILSCLGCVMAATAAAQGVLLPGSAATNLAQEQKALRDARRQALEARSRSARLDWQANHASEEADRASRRAAALAARIQESEADIRAAQARIAIIARLQRDQNARLADRRQPIARLTAALQTLSRRPTIAALLQPGSFTDVVHVRAVLGTVAPVIRQRTAGLRAELARSRQLRVGAEQAAAALRESSVRLADRQVQLQRVEAERRLASRQYRSGANLESDRALAMGEKARDIADLMDQLRVAGDLRDRLASLPGPVPRPARPDDAAPPRAEARQAAAASPAYRLPVVGEVVTGMGEVDESGIRARGLTIATEPGAQAVAPTQGRVVFAGPYGGYGQIVILDHGQGWTTLITSLASLSVGVGDTLRQGDPIGTAGGPGGRARPTVTVELRRNGRPIDIMALAGRG